MTILGKILGVNDDAQIIDPTLFMAIARERKRGSINGGHLTKIADTFNLTSEDRTALNNVLTTLVSKTDSELEIIEDMLTLGTAHGYTEQEIIDQYNL
jgi:hypothetical protein